MTHKCVCSNRHCGWQGEDTDLLRAPSPFDVGEEILACPKCRDFRSIRLACAAPGCWKEVTCGAPTPDGYILTCGDHVPSETAGDTCP